MATNISDWIKAAFPVQHFKKNEANFPCPYCGHESFYFNVRKKVGYCHSARCGRKPSLSELIQIKGYGPSDFYVTQTPELVVKPEVEITVPGRSLFEYPRDNWAVEALECRGLTMTDISKWNIHADPFRIYIPVVENNKVVQVVGRAIDRRKLPKEGFKTDIKPKYKYAEGKSISNFIFGWGKEMQDWSYITLVENTFNAIAWRDKFNCSTNFGSHLSDKQLATLARSRIGRVVLAWDGDAIAKAYNTASKLRAQGIYTIILSYINFNQPDELPFTALEDAIKKASTSAPFNYGPLRHEVMINV